MRIRSLSLALLLAAALPAQSLKEQRFTVLVGENRTGTTLLTWTDPNHASVATATSVRGLRFSGHGTYTFDGQGLLTSLEARSEASLGAPQTEHFLWKDGRAEWDSTIEHGRADVKVPGFYVSAAAGDAVETGFLVQALRRAPGQTLALLPEGRARLRTLGKEKLGSLQVELVEVTGLGLDPAMAWLDPAGELFALVPGLIRAGFEDRLQRLKEVEAARTGALGRERARALLRPLAGPFLVQDVALFDAEAAVVRPHRSVLVEGSVITAVGPAGALKAPAGATVVDGRGKTLLPGLWDMHGHLDNETDSLLALASGITTYRDLGNEARRRDELVAAFTRGELAGPRVIKCLLIDGPGPNSAQFGAKAATEAEARAVVAQAARDGYVQIKLYGSLDPALVPILVQEAHARGLRVSGHIPKDLNPRAAVAAGYDEIQHIYFPLMQLLPEGWPHHNDAGRMQVPADKVGTLDLDGPEAQAWLAFLKAHHTALDPTISLWENLLMDRPGQRPAMLAPLWDRLPLLMRRGSLGGGLDAAGDKDARLRASFKVSLDFLKRAHALGIPLVPGTDGPSGIQLHRELEVMVLAGIPAGDVLRQATYGSALVMGRTADLGSIAPGKAADLILLDGDPTQDIAAVRKIIWVLHDGRKLDREATLEALGLGLPAPHAGP